MKKILLLFFAMVAASTCALADDETITLSSGSYSSTAKNITWTGTSCSINQTQGSSSTAVNSSYVSAPRWYAKHVITFKANDGYTLTGATVVCTSTSYASALKGSTYSTGASATVSGSTVTITTDGDFTITMGAQARISSVVVTYENASGKKSAGLKWDPSSITYFTGDKFTSPTFTKATTAEVTFETDDDEVATVDENGVVTLVGGVGPVNITATSAENDEYKAGTSTCTINVSTPTAVTCAEAAEVGNALGNNETTTIPYAATGYVTSTDGTVTSGQQTFYMADAKDGGNILQGYKANIPNADEPLNAGDKVRMTGYITKYVNSAGITTTIEIKNGNVTILERSQEKVDTLTATAQEAYTAGAALAPGSYSKDVYRITAYVDVIKTAYSSSAKTETFTLIDTKGATITDTLVVYKATLSEAALAGAQVRVTGKLQNYNGTIEVVGAKCEILTQGPKDAGLTWSKTSIYIKSGGTLTAPTFTKQTTADVTFASSNESVATVSADGVISLAGENGSATITASSPANEEYLAGTATCSITVYYNVNYSKVTEIESGAKYLLSAFRNDSTIYAAPLASTKTYGYLSISSLKNAKDTIYVRNYIDDEFVLTAVDGGYTMQDNTGRYYSFDGEHNSFQVGTDAKTWACEPQVDGTFKFTMNGGTLQFGHGTFKTFGIYTDVESPAVLPLLYKKVPTATFEEQALAKESVKQYATTPGFATFASGDFTLQNYNSSSEWGTYYYAFTLTNKTTTTENADYTNAYESACGGAKNGSNYVVWYDNTYNGGDTITLARPSTITGFYVTNTTYTENVIVNGNSAGRKLNQDGDYLILHISGLDADKQSTGTVDYTLASTTDNKMYYVKAWRWVNLSSLGATTKYLTFSMTGSDTGQWGLNTPTYFAMDDLGGVAPEKDAELEVVDWSATGINDVNAGAETNLDGKFIQNGRMVIVKDGKTYSVAGQAIR